MLPQRHVRAFMLGRLDLDAFFADAERRGVAPKGKGLAKGTPHDEMVESFGLTWLLAGTSLGHIVGAGAILGCTSAGFL